MRRAVRGSASKSFTVLGQAQFAQIDIVHVCPLDGSLSFFAFLPGDFQYFAGMVKDLAQPLFGQGFTGIEIARLCEEGADRVDVHLVENAITGALYQVSLLSSRSIVFQFRVVTFTFASFSINTPA